MRKNFHKLRTAIGKKRRSRETSPHVKHRDGSSNSTEQSSEDSNESDRFLIIETQQNGKHMVWREPSEETTDFVYSIFANLFDSSNHVNIPYVDQILNKCPPDEDILTIEDLDHYNLLHKAIIYNSTTLVTLLVNHGCDINGGLTRKQCNRSKICSHRDLGPLHLASFLGHTDIVKILLQYGANKHLTKRVHISSVTNGPVHLEPEVFRLCRPLASTDMLTRCGCREAVFFSVLGDQVDVLEILLGENAHCCANKYGYLLQLACRVGAYNCLKHLLQLYPDEVNKKDSDGLYPLLMAMTHGFHFISLLLRHGADMYLLDDFASEGSNILHLVYKSLPTQNLDALTHCSLADVTRMCLQYGVNINAKRQGTLFTPLHDLLTSINCVWKLTPKDLRNCDHQNYVSRLASFDEDILECIHLMLQQDYDVNTRCSNGRTLLQVLFSNTNHIPRCMVATDHHQPVDIRNALSLGRYGLDNVFLVSKLLITAGCPLTADEFGNTPLRDMVSLMCTVYIGSNQHCLELLEVPEIQEGYMALTDLLLSAGIDPNVYNGTHVTPLLFLLSHVANWPYMKRGVITLSTACALVDLMKMYLQRGAVTECYTTNMETGITRMIGCFDMLISILQAMQEIRTRTSQDLEVLKTLALPLIQYGANTMVFQQLLYKTCNGTMVTLPGTHCTPMHSFLYQYLQFGVLNMEYVNDGSYYEDLMTILYHQTEHYTLYDTLEAMSLCCKHTQKCEKLARLIAVLARRPRQLKSLCRLAIYEAMNKKLEPNVRQLPIPLPIKNYLVTFID